MMRMDRLQLTVAVQGGLCNRLRALLSAYYLAEEHDWDLSINWAKNQECFAWYDELFEPLQSVCCQVVHGRWWNTPVCRRNLHLPALARQLIYDKQIKNYHPKHHGELTQYARHRRLYLSTGYALADYPAAYACRLRPVASLRERIQTLVSQFGDYTVGVHIRRTDNIAAIKGSPLEGFVAAMQREVEHNSHVRFYVATDDDAVKRMLQARFAGRIVTQHVQGGRADLVGMEEAVVDLFVLSRTDKLLGSYWSSFTDMAAEMGGMSVEIVGQT